MGGYTLPATFAFEPGVRKEELASLVAFVRPFDKTFDDGRITIDLNMGYSFIFTYYCDVNASFGMLLSGFRIFIQFRNINDTPFNH